MCNGIDVDRLRDLTSPERRRRGPPSNAPRVRRGPRRGGSGSRC
jgi:hypothetical protein